MSIITTAIARPVATTLLMLGVCLSGTVAFFLLPAAPVPQIDYPVISIYASMPGASPQTMASSVATPLERRLGQIAGVTEMTSSSSLSSARISMQFDLDRNIDGAQRDIQAAIAAARADLPTNLRNNPIFRTSNPAEVPVVIIAMTSDRLTQGQLFEIGSNILQQKFAQIEGVGQVLVGGSALPGVRVEINPSAISQYGVSLESVRAAIAATNFNGPKGVIEDGERRLQIYANDQSRRAVDYRGLIIGYRNGAPLKLVDVAEVIDSIEDTRNYGISNGRTGVQIHIFRQPGANFIELVDRIKALMPPLTAALPADVEMRIVQDRTLTIRTSLHEIEFTLALTVLLVVAVVFFFLRDARATLIPSISVPVSLTGAFAGMYLLGYTLNNLSLMALTIATGFIVDDSIVVVENVVRLMENGMERTRAALIGARQVAFTVLAMTLSLIAVFLPIMFMGGIIGRMMREFAATLSFAILVSLILSVTATPMLCVQLLRSAPQATKVRIFRISEAAFDLLHRGYVGTLTMALKRRRATMLVLFALIGLNFYLFSIIPKGFFPVQDTGRMRGAIVADQSVSFSVMKEKLEQFVAILKSDPSIESATGAIGGTFGPGGSVNVADLLVTLKPLRERGVSADKIMARLRPKLAQVSGAQVFLQSVQDIRIGGRSSSALYQYTLQADDLSELRLWAPRITDALRKSPVLLDVNSDQQDKGLRTEVVVDHETAARLNLTASQIDNTLYDAFGQRQVSTIYEPLNQYHVVMEVAPNFRKTPNALSELFIGAGRAPVARVANASAERMIPFAAFSSLNAGPTPMQVNHQGHQPAVTISFNLAEGKSLSDAAAAIKGTMLNLGAPAGIHGAFAGNAAGYQDALANQPVMIAAALAAVYIVLGMLYESFFHPLTILSTLPSAGGGAAAALMLCGTDLSIIAMIGVLLLIGVVMKNAIILVDFAIDARRSRGFSAEDAIVDACSLRFRPILITTLVAIMGAAPLAIGSGEGAEMRQPLGVAIIGGLIVSQLLTLYTTPVVFLYVDRLARRVGALRAAVVPHERVEA
ncbi:MAG: multidrug transporter subunit MdtC [Methylocystis sp.]|nr:MAG: multidrug transporter subunit MdtC [Methylocystis sp.]